MKLVHLRSFTLVCLSLLASLIISARPAAAQGPTSDYKHYLPMVRGGQTTNPPPQGIQGAFFAQPDIKTANSSIAVDKNGGMHLAYNYYLPDVDHPQAVYLYCPITSNCGDPNNWNGVAMADLVREVQLDLTPSGQPRLLIRTTSTVLPGTGKDYYYAACDQSCTDPNQWAVIYLLTTDATAVFDVNDDSTPQHNFALDPAGRPRFIYFDYNYANAEPDHLGTYYVFCDADCTDQNNWYETKISLGDNPNYEIFKYASLTFTKQGQPRAVADGYPLNSNESGMYYLFCDNNCDDGSNWQRTYLFERGSEPRVSWDLELDSQDRPRLAFYEGSQLGGQGDVLYYSWCNSGCQATGGWSRYNIGLGSSSGKHPDLELDGQDRPRIVYIMSGGSGVGYIWCNSNCQANQGQWQSTVVDTAAELEAEYPVAIPPHCDAGFWDTLIPALALDPSGNPRIAFDGAYEARCLYDDPNDNQPPYYQFSQIRHTVRVNFFPQP